MKIEWEYLSIVSLIRVPWKQNRENGRTNGWTISKVNDKNESSGSEKPNEIKEGKNKKETQTSR